MDLSRILRRALMESVYVIRGIEYQFLSIDLDEEGIGYKIVVNVNLPKKDMSYITSIFSRKIFDILDNIMMYIGTSFSYSETIFVNGKLSNTDGVYISEKDLTKIINTLNNDVSEIYLDFKPKKPDISFSVKWLYGSQPYNLMQNSLNFFFNLKLSNFNVDRKHKNPNPEKIEKLSGYLRYVITENDDFFDTINDKVYSILSEDIEISADEELYFDCSIQVIKVENFSVAQTKTTEFDKDFFI